MESQQNEKPTQVYTRKLWKEALQEMQQWEKWELRCSDYSNHRRFTLRCISKGIVLLSLKLDLGRKDISIRTRAVIYRAERQHLQDRVRNINTILLDNGGRITAGRSRLFSLVTTPTTQLKCIEFINKVWESRFIMVRDRQENKFNRLTNRFNNGDRDRNNNSTQTTGSGNQAQDTYSTNNGNSQSQSSSSTNCVNL